MSFVSLYLYVPDEGSLLPKYRDCTTSNDFELYIIYIYIIYVENSEKQVKRYFNPIACIYIYSVSFHNCPRLIPFFYTVILFL